MNGNLSYDRIKTDFEDLRIFKETSYTRSYSHFIKYFAEIDIINSHHLVIGSHFVYGWMPTIIDLNLQRTEAVLLALNAAKRGKLVNEEELEIVKECINNSMVGASKLLHFVNPRVYAIWDSRIFRYLTGKSSTYGIEKPKAYLDYLKDLNTIKDHQDYPKLHARIEEILELELTHMRAIEMIMFAKGAKQNGK